jgi:D-apiose dehydrogenase
MSGKTNRPLRGALIGCGFFGRIQLEAWRRMNDVEIVAACDADRDRAQAAAPKAYVDAVEMLASESLDFVDIATRPDSHLALLRSALERSLPVICQKPLASNLEEGLEMVRLARNATVPVMIHENWRWQPWYREAHRLISEGAIGRPLAYNFRLRQADGLGERPYPNQPYFAQMPRLLIYETLIHPIDTARFLFGDIRTIYAHVGRANPKIAGEDRAVLTLTHEAGADGVIDGHRYTNPVPPGPAMGDALFEGDAGLIRINAEGKLWVGDRLAYEYSGEPGYKGDSVFAIQRHFIECLRSGTQPETHIEDYLQSFVAVEAAYESVTKGVPIAVSHLLGR